MENFKGFGSKFFAGNRAELKARFGGDPIIITGNGLLQKTRDDDAFAFQQSANFWYLTGINEPDMVLVMDASEEYIILPKRDARFEVFSGGFDSLKIARLSGINTIYSNQEGWRRLAGTLKTVRQVGTFKPEPEYDRIYNVYTNPAARRLVKRLKNVNKNLSLADLRPELADMRSIKSEAEISAIKYSIDHTVEAYSLISKNFAGYKNEREIEAELICYGAKHGLNQAFSPIVANGQNACTLHYHQNQAGIDKKQITLLDIGYSTNGYCADLTRVICPEPSNRQEAVYSAVLEIQTYALGLLKSGTIPREYEKQVARFAGEKLRELGLIGDVNPKSVFKHFRHRTSHFLGIDVHDVGDYSKPLASGMVLTVEPGIYIDEESIGVRIEDDVLISEKGNEVLSKNLSRRIEPG
ncbi:aminopeptidase P N-terminal domain-containing protein [Candidatus Parcubacteria bacterium]|nr:aminopeptidase P N-terminal domain-containing protein [Candidatus Parcubacteria bacterium]